MRKIFLVWIVLLFIGSVYSQNSKFYEKILDDLNCRNCYFVSLHIESDSYSGKIVVENDDLFNYIKATKNLDEKEYKTFLLDLLRKNQSLKMDFVSLDKNEKFLVGKNLRKYAFRVLKPSHIFENISSQGCEKLIQHYFPIKIEQKESKLNCKESIKQNAKDLLMFPRFDMNEQNNVISKLFDLEIPISIDDISGSPTIWYLVLD